MKILVIRFGAIGDLILVEPILRMLHHSGHEVHLLTKPAHAPMFENHEALHSVYSWQADETLWNLRQQGFDAVLDAHNNLRSHGVCLALWPATVYRMPKEIWKKLPLPGRFKQVRSVKERLLQAVHSLLTEMPEHLGPWPGIVPLNKPFAYRVWVLGGTYATKQMPSEMAVSLMNQIGGHWLLLGSPSDKEKAKGIIEDLNANVQAEICCSQELRDSASILAGAVQVVSGDTGMAHWAAALHVPLHVVWGNTSSRFGLAPGQWGGSEVHHHQVPNLSCRPCSKFGYSQCPKGHFNCMRNQNLASIATAIKNLD
jgi:ADP-heptose:LPS heptosyltransferase